MQTPDESRGYARGGDRAKEGGGRGLPHVIFSLFLSLREREKKRIAPAEQPSCTRCVQPPPRAARGGGYPPPDFSPPSPPTANCWQWWGVGRGGWGVRCRVEQKCFFII
nr:hypothetical protein [Morchella crassipes]